MNLECSEEGRGRGWKLREKNNEASITLAIISAFKYLQQKALCCRLCHCRFQTTTNFIIVYVFQFLQLQRVVNQEHDSLKYSDSWLSLQYSLIAISVFEGYSL
jgi:hypothetical protein